VCAVWDAYIKVGGIHTGLTHIFIYLQGLSPSKAKIVKKFRSKPFPLYDAIGDLIDGTQATGEGVFRAGRASAFNPLPSTIPNSSFAINPALEEISRDMEKSREMEKSDNETDTQIPSRPLNKAPGASFYGSDTYSSQDEAAISLPRLSKRKRAKTEGPSKSAGASTSDPRKVRRISAGQGMSEMAGSLRDMADFLKVKQESQTQKDLQTCPQTPKLPEDPQERAIAILEDDASLSDNELNEVIGYFLADRDLARAYATLKTSQRRGNFLEHQLTKLRKE
jgi:hypothetical protein